jgi:hypothetical protein
MSTEEHRIVDFIVSFERRLDASRFTVDREGSFARRRRIASGFIEREVGEQLPRIVLDSPGSAISHALQRSIRLRWIAMQNELRERDRDAAEE